MLADRCWFFCLVILGCSTFCSDRPVLMAQTSVGNDWTGWRGANRDDLSKETGLLKSWPENGPKNLWTVDTGGLGYAGFAAVGERLFTLGSTGDSEFAICLNVQDGSTIWKQTIDDLFENNWGDGPRNTPTVDGDRVYVLSASGQLKCLSTEDGSEKWAVSLTEQLGGERPFWGFSESPLIDGEQVICTPGGKQGAVVALNKLTGATIWQSKDFTNPCHYSSIIVADVNQQKQYIQLFEKALVGFDADNGDVIWQQDWSGRIAVIPTPIFEDNKVYVSSGYGAGSMLVDVSDGENVKKVWFSSKMKNHHGGVILLDGHYYGYSDKVGWLCQSAKTGGVVWKEKEALQKGAISYADNRFYLLEEKSGQVVLINAAPDGWQEFGRFQLKPLSENRKQKGKVWVHPVISNGRMFLRDQEMIYCFDISGR